MGLWELLNKPLFSASNEYVISWHEPHGWGMRLRNDWWLRLAIVPIGAVLAAGLSLLVLGMTERVPQHFEWSGLLTFATFGAIFAGFVAMFVWTHDDDRGAVAARDDELYVRRSEAALGSLMRTVTITWRYPAIDQCVIVPGRSLGKSFSVMVVASRGEVDLVAVARYVDPEQLARHLAARGVHVSFADALPAKFMKPYYPPKLIGGLAAAAAVVFVVGLAVGHRHFGPPQDDKQQAQAGQQEAARMKNPRDAAAPGREFLTGQFFHAMQIVFMRIRPDGQLDPNDSYKSDWIGTPVGQQTNTVTCKGAKVVGLHGTRMGLVHSIGLVLE